MNGVSHTARTGAGSALPGAALARRLAGGSVRAATALLDLLLPPRCLACGAAVDRTGSLCAACWGTLHFIDQPLCRHCGRPFDLPPGAGEGEDGAERGEWLCGPCLAQPPAYDGMRAAVAYDDASRPLILGFKHGDRTACAPLFAAWMARAGAGMLDGADLLVPVPLHRWRLLSRRYNQAALLCHAIARILARRRGADAPVRPGPRVAADLLVRRRATPVQGRLSRLARARNMAGAFAVHPGRRSLLAGRRVVLVDDVYTTGATVAECVRVLRRAGAARVDVLTLARVLKPDPAAI